MPESENRPAMLTGSDLNSAPTISHDEARSLTDQINQTVEAAWELIVRAYREGAWRALNYSSWDAYCLQEFGTTRLRVPREERPEMVTSLRQAGLSIRAIASATGVDKNTVQADLAQVSEIHTPDDHIDELVNESLGRSEFEGDRTASHTIIGRDGKTYPQSRPAPPSKEPRRPSFRTDIGRAVSQMSDCTQRISKWARAIDELRGDNRYPRYRAAFEQEIGNAVVMLVAWSWPHLTDEQHDRIFDLLEPDESTAVAEVRSNLDARRAQGTPHPEGD